MQPCARAPKRDLDAGYRRIRNAGCYQRRRRNLEYAPVCEIPARGFLTANLLFMQATVVPLLVMLIFLGANKDTRCRMFLWFHRHLRIRPGKPTQGYQRQFSRITAMEAIFINWLFYVVNISLFDTRVLGPFHWGTYAAFGITIAWGLYLLVFKMWQQKAMGYAFRYAIPTSAFFWLAVEMASAWRWITEYWLYPFKYPIGLSLAAIVFISCFYAIYAIPKAKAESVTT